VNQDTLRKQTAAKPLRHMQKQTKRTERNLFCTLN